MPPVPMNSTTAIFCLSRRSYAVVAAAEASRAAPAAVAAMVVRAAAAAGEPGAAAERKKEEVFWMRDPKTGNWMPENRFGDVDAAELRARLLNYNNNSE